MEVSKVRGESLTLLNTEKLKWEKEITELREQLAEKQEKLQRAEERVAAVEKAGQETAATLVLQKELACEQETKILEITASLTNVKSACADLENQNAELRREMEKMSAPEVIISDFKRGDVYKGEMVAARLAGIAAYKASAEFADEIQALTTRAIARYKDGSEYTAGVEKLRAVWEAEYSKSISFRQAVGLEAGKMSRQVVECCREFFKDDLKRPGDEFGEFFMAYVRQWRGREAGSSSLGSVCRPSL